MTALDIIPTLIAVVLGLGWAVGAARSRYVTDCLDAQALRYRAGRDHWRERAEAAEAELATRKASASDRTRRGNLTKARKRHDATFAMQGRLDADVAARVAA